MTSEKPYRINLDRGDSYVVVVPDIGEIGCTGYTAEGPYDRDERDQAAQRVYDRWLDKMRESDRKLFLAMREIPELKNLVGRAAAGEWNDYFGDHVMNMQHLVCEIQIIIATIARDEFARYAGPDPSMHARILKIHDFMSRVLDGDFDGTKSEADEWAKSGEGKSALGDLMKGARP